MQASHTDLTKIIEGEKQYIVPLFQRPYSWQQGQWETLWEDLVVLINDSERQTHYFGAFVTLPTTSVPEGVTKYLLIDGQQRLTTMFLLLAAIRDVSPAEDKLGSQIEERFLINKFSEVDRFRLLPTQQDRRQYAGIINNALNINQENESRLAQCYRYFERKIKATQIDLKSLMHAATKRLAVVSIVLDSGDDPYLVFESLNSKGRDLTPADLIRNYFFMRIHVDQQEEINANYWQPMQERIADSDDLTEFIRHYLVRGRSFIKREYVYLQLKEKFREQDAAKGLVELTKFSKHYAKLLDPTREEDLDIREKLIRLKRIEVTTAYPFLLDCFESYSNNELTRTQLLDVLHLIETFTIRRWVCGEGAKYLNKLYPTLFGKAQKASDFVRGVWLELRNQRFPKDGIACDS
jgi:uncharacterized protein with ParB-like and HNH nuclease domain